MTIRINKLILNRYIIKKMSVLINLINIPIIKLVNGLEKINFSILSKCKYSFGKVVKSFKEKKS